MGTHVLDPRDDRGTALAPGDGIAVERVTEGTFEEFSETLGRGFMEGAVPGPVWRDLHAAGLRRPGGLGLLARLGGRPVAAATMAISDDPAGRVGVLFGASALPEFRRRGAQSALLRWRLARARAEGCDLAEIQARPGTSSARNVARAGFRLVHHKVLMAAG